MRDIIDKLLIYSGLNAKTFSEKIGLKRPQAIYDILTGKTKAISQAMTLKILSAFPEISKSWLLTGEGEMIKSPAIIQKIGDNSAHNTQVAGDAELAVCQQKVEYLERLLEEKERMIQVLLDNK